MPPINGGSGFGSTLHTVLQTASGDSLYRVIQAQQGTRVSIGELSTSSYPIGVLPAGNVSYTFTILRGRGNFSEKQIPPFFTFAPSSPPAAPTQQSQLGGLDLLWSKALLVQGTSPAEPIFRFSDGDLSAADGEFLLLMLHPGFTTETGVAVGIVASFAVFGKAWALTAGSDIPGGLSRSMPRFAVPIPSTE